MHLIRIAQGQDPQKVADLIGGTLIMVNGDIAHIIGGNIERLKV